MDDGKTGYDPSPVNPMPPVVIVIFLLIFGVEAVFALAEAGYIGGEAAIAWRLRGIEDYGFSPEVLAWMLETARFPPEHLMRFVTYPFLHLGFVHMAIAAVIFLAMGKLVGEVLGQIAVLALFFGGSLVAALVYGGLLGDPIWLVGAYPGAYAMIGGFTFILWTNARMTGGSQVQAFALIALLMAIQLGFSFFSEDNLWVADLSGFFTGFGLCFLFVPGAWAAILAKLRDR